MKKRNPKTPQTKSTKKKGSKFDKIIRDIKDIKIQGATDTAKAGIQAYLLKNDEESVKRILNARPTEPLLQNSIKILQKAKTKKQQQSKSKKIINYIKKSHQKIAVKGSTLIKKDMNVFSHCHSTTVIDLIKYAKRKRKKNFVVYTTEVEPLLQGRQTARDLAKAKIKVIVVPDLAAEQYLKKCDLLLFGVDAFTKKGLANKIGTSTLCRIAKHFHIPRYACGASLKFAKKVKLEKRKPSEVWRDNHKYIEVENPAFDFINKKLLTGVISEFGIQTYKQFTKSAQKQLNDFK